MMRKYLNKLLFIFLVLSSSQLWAQKATLDSSLQRWKLSDLQRVINENEGPLILNFWASFCKPCLAELPHFQSIAKKYDSAGVKLILINLDSKDWYGSKLKEFMVKRNIIAPVRYLDETNADLFCPAVDSTWSGAIPATLLINPQTGFRKFFDDAVSGGKLEAAIMQMILKPA